MTEVIAFPDEITRAVRGWLYERNIDGHLERVCEFTPDGIVDIAATFQQEKVLDVTIPNERDSRVYEWDGGWNVEIGGALTPDEQRLARGRALGHMLLRHMAVRAGTVDVLSWLQRDVPTTAAAEFAVEAVDQIAERTVTSKYLWGKFYPRRVR